MSSLIFEPLSPVLRCDLHIERSIGLCFGIPLVLFHKRGNSLINEDQTQCVELLEKLNCGPVLEFEDNDWAWCQADPCNFNCHSLAIGSAVGLTPDDWLEGFASESTLYANPTQILLDSFYERIDNEESENDVFVLADSKTGKLFHSGFLRNIDGIPFAVSKFGEGPVLATSFTLISLVFGMSFDEVRWYRLRENEPKQSSIHATAPNFTKRKKPRFSLISH
jgi:hypothetical protein